MKKTLAFVLALFMIFALVGCGGEGTTAKPPLTEDEIPQMYTDPNSFKGREVTLVGKILGEPEKDDSGIYFQMYADPENYERNTIVGYLNKEASLSSDAYVRVVGVVDGAFEGENMMGGKVTAPKIVASAVEEISYMDAVSPTTKSVEINSTQSQKGYDITLQKVEFSDTETRLYLSIANNGSANFSVYSFNSKIVQAGKQFEERHNYNADYKEIQTDLMPGITTEGIIAFPSIDQANFTFICKGSSENWNEEISLYTFEVAVD